MRPKFDTYKEYMNWRLDRRVETVKNRAEKVKRRYLAKLGDFPDDEEDRLWLDKIAVGNGLDICCGDFLVGEEEQALGVDGHEGMVGTDYHSEGDELAFQEPGKLDFIVTNYLDGLATPLKALNEWWRCLKEDGVLGIVCRDADQYENNMGPLENKRRQALYNKIIISQYLYRAGFTKVEVETTKHKTLRVKAIK